MLLSKLEQVERNIMASIENLRAELAVTTQAIVDLQQAVSNEKQELKSKLDDLDAKISGQSALIEQLKSELAAGEIPDTLISELADATDNLKKTSAEIKNLITPDVEPVEVAAPAEIVEPVFEVAAPAEVVEPSEVVE